MPSPIPSSIQPMLLKPGCLPAADADYAYEWKFDGMRAIVFADPGRVRIQSRNMRDCTAQFPELHALGSVLKRKRVVLDAEIICTGDTGRPCFETLRSRIVARSPLAVAWQQAQAPVTLIIFDLLFDGRSTMEPPYTRRRAARLYSKPVRITGWKAWSPSGWTARSRMFSSGNSSSAAGCLVTALVWKHSWSAHVAAAAS
jgi:ATP-dependent DNA ligase